MSEENSKLLESDLKGIVLNYLYTKNIINVNSIIINELMLDNFSRRVDLALISAGKFIAIEIKSEADTLNRLSGQTQKYLQYFDKVIVVTSDKHIIKVIDSVPENVEVWLANNQGVKVKKRGKLLKVNNKFNYLDLLKKSELIKLSKDIGFKKISVNKLDIKNNIINIGNGISRLFLKKFLFEMIRLRYESTSSLFYALINAQGEITKEDIGLLSPYATARNLVNKSRVKSNSIWLKLEQNINDDPYLIELAGKSQGNVFGQIPDSIKKLIN